MRSVIIPARAGSKRIPRKNISSFLGKPIIQYSIQSAIDSNLFDEIVISTNDGEVAEIATGLGVPTKPNRPQRLSDDVTPIVDVLRYEIEDKSLGNHSSVTLLFACAPLLEPSDLVSATKLLESQESCSSLMTVAEFPVPIEWALSVVNNQVLFNNPELLSTSSDNLKQSYFDAGQFYIYKPKSLGSGESGLITEGILPFLIPRNKAVDIDNYDDWKFAERLYSAQFNL